MQKKFKYTKDMLLVMGIPLIQSIRMAEKQIKEGKYIKADAKMSAEEINNILMK